MKIQNFIWALCAMPLTLTAYSQHADVTFSYEEDSIVIRDGIEGFTDGLQIFQGTFPTSGFAIRFTENPGWLSEIENGDMLLAGDRIDIEILESQSFDSFLTWYDPVLDAMSSTSTTIRINDNGGSATADLTIGNLELVGDNPQFIQTADGMGEIHAHIDFFLSDVAEFGAYGILFRLNTDNPSFESSPPVWLVFNYGMSPAEFAEFAIPAFAGDSILLGDINGDGVVSLVDVAPFVNLITTGGFLPEGDINGDGVVNLLDVGPFVGLLIGN